MKHEKSTSATSQISSTSLVQEIEPSDQAEQQRNVPLPMVELSRLSILERASDVPLPVQKPGLERRLQQWFITNTFAPSWLPTRLQHPVFGYLIALLIQTLAVLISFYLDAQLQLFIFVGSLEVLAIALVALSWGVGPSILATLYGALLLDYVILPPQFNWVVNTISDIYQLLLFILIGLAISIVSSQTERARRRVERFADSLAKEHARLEAIIETVPDVVAIYDKNGNVIQANEVGRQSRIFAPDLQRNSLEELVSAQEAFTLTGEPVVADHLPVTQALLGVTVEGTEVRFLDSAGQERFISISAAPLRNTQGEIDGVVSITRDLSALHQSERKAASRAMELEAILEAMADGLCLIDKTGFIVRSNAAYQEIMGVTEQNMADFVALPREERHDLLRVRDEQGFPLPYEARPEMRILKGEVLKGATAADIQLHNLLGREVQLSVSGAPLQKDGEVVAALILRDVTERRLLEQRTHDALDAMLTMAETLVIRSDESMLEVQNKADAAKKVALRMAGLTSRVLGRQRISIFLVEHATGSLLPVAIVGLSRDSEANWWEYAEQHTLNIHDPQVAALMAQLQAGENVLLDVQSEHFSPWGQYIHIQPDQTALLAPMNIGKQLIGFLALGQEKINELYTSEDIALASAIAQLLALVFERERLLFERSEAQATELALRTANQRMEEFLGMISHELKTPLTSMKGNTQLAIRQLKGSMQTFERIIGLYEATEQQSRRLNRLVDDLLDVSRSQAGHLELIEGPCDLREIVHEVIQEQRKMWPGRSIQLTIDETIALPLAADADRIAQVIGNYLNNALKYSDSTCPVFVEARREGQQAYLAVRDEGPGLPEDEKEHIWNRFHRVPGIEVRSNTHFSQSGLGLGLYISKTIIEDQEGRVGVQSVPGVGSTFWFCLPLRAEE